jgi:hypothetical protein
VAAPAKLDPNKQLGESLGNIGEALARASGDPLVKAMSGGQILSMMAHIIQLEAQRVQQIVR